MSVTPPRSRWTAPRRSDGRRAAARAAMVSSEIPKSIATAVAASTFARLPRPSSGVSMTRSPAGVVTRARIPSMPRSSMSRGAHRRRPRSPKVTLRPANCVGTRHHARIVRIAHQHVVGVGALRGSPPWHRQSRRETQRNRDARRRRWSRRERQVRRSPPACGSPRRDSSPVPSPPRPACRAAACSDSGRPMWLFRFPLFFTTRYARRQNSAIVSFVVVLPALPVIATTSSRLLAAPRAPGPAARASCRRPR